MDVTRTAIPDVLLLTPRRHADARGYFCETWSAARFAALGLPDFVQDNHSLSLRAGTLRGLHHQVAPHEQGKLVRCVAGRLFDVALDIRPGSPSFGRWVGAELSSETGRMLWIPPGFAHGFVTRVDRTEIAYKCSAPYAPSAERSIAWWSAGVDWPIDEKVAAPILSDKDRDAPPLQDVFATETLP